MGFFDRLFRRYPKYQESAYGTIYSAVVSRLTRTGVRVGGTAGYPRIEVHTITEGERLEKEGQLRIVSMTVESMSDSSLGAAVTMNDDNLRLLTENDFTLDGWNCIGIVPTQLQDLTETSDSAKIIYRLLQQVDIYLERVKTDTDPEENNNQN